MLRSSCTGTGRQSEHEVSRCTVGPPLWCWPVFSGLRRMNDVKVWATGGATPTEQSPGSIREFGAEKSEETRT